MKKEVWMPHAGHLIVGNKCRFHLNTYVNGYIVSTVGEYIPDSSVRRISREIRGWPLDLKGDAEEVDFMKRNAIYENDEIVGFGEDIGLDRKYETMVFEAQKSEHKCCPYEMKFSRDVDMEGYNTAEAAYKGHLRMVKKYKNKKRK